MDDALNIAIVDDEPEISDFVRFKLSGEAPHFSITTLGSACEALDFVRGNPVDCILSDYQIPGMDGMELLLELRRLGHGMPFIFITGQGNEEVAREAFKNGASDYFTKEVGFAHFTRIINSIEHAVRQRKTELLRAEAEVALREAENRFKSLVEDAHFGVYIVQDGRFMFVNSSFANLFGYSVEELLAHETCLEIVVPEERDSVKENLKKRLGGSEKSIRYQFRTKRKDGKIMHVEVHGASTVYKGKPAMVGNVINISAFKKTLHPKLAEEEIVRLRQKLEEGERLARFGSWEWDVISDKIVRSEGLARIYGLKMSESGGSYADFLGLVHPDDREMVMKSVSDALEGIRPLDFEARIIRKDGTERVIHSRAEANFDESGKAVRMFGMAQDVTGLVQGACERRNIEEEFKGYKNSSRLESTKRNQVEQRRTDLYEMLTHDLRSPLMSILGYSDFLLEKKCDMLDAECMEGVIGIRRSGAGILRIIENFTTLTRIESGTVMLSESVVSLTDLLVAVRDEYERLARKKKVELMAELPKSPLTAIADRMYLQRALCNLVQNAINYTPPGGRVVLSAGRRGENGSKSRSVFFSVSDTGAGVPQADKNKIFEKYYRASNSAGVKGTGLGLFIVKAVAEAHGGKVELESALNSGSTFRLVLPQRQAR